MYLNGACDLHQKIVGNLKLELLLAYVVIEKHSSKKTSRKVTIAL